MQKNGPESLANPSVWLEVLGNLWRLALPVLAEEILNLLVGYTDWWLAGHFLKTADHQAAMGLVAYLTWLLPSLFATLVIGSTAMVSRFVGARQSDDALRVVNQAMFLGSLLALALVVVSVLGGSTFVAAMQLESKAAELAVIYLWIIIPGIPFMMLEQVGSACLRGAGDTYSGFLARVVVNIVNAIVSPILLLGLGPFPELGWAGLAIGTLCGHVVGGSIILWWLCRGRSGLRLHRFLFTPDRDLIRRLLRIGLPGGIDVLALIGCHLTYLSIINRLGTLAAAAHGLGIQIEALSYLPGTAFAVAATTIAGQSLGAGNAQRAVRGVGLTCAMTVAFMSCAAFVLFQFGTELATFFTGDATNPVSQLTGRLLRIAALASPFLGLLQCTVGGLRGAGDTRLPLIITFVGLIGIRLPLACLFAWDHVTLPILGIVIPGLGWGVIGAWWAMAGDVFVRSMIATGRFIQGGWKRVTI
jgi:putative MATE family efflux protein